MEQINILVTLDERYLLPLRVMLQSLFLNNPGESFAVYLAYADIPAEKLDELDRFCRLHGSALIPVRVADSLFGDAPVVRYYSKAMYYRLLAHKLLPEHLERVLYLDPDILILNPVRTLYETDLTGWLFGACIHTTMTKLADQVNKIRLNAYESEGYYNSGVLLINLAAQRAEVDEQDLFRYVEAHKLELLLPDQDMLNGMYGERIKPLDDSLYNYSANRYETHRVASAGVKDLPWVMHNTVVLHFCGKNKPWSKPTHSRFGVLYQHYAVLAERAMQQAAQTAPCEPT